MPKFGDYEKDDCPTCEGMGWYPDDTFTQQISCGRCGGTGKRKGKTS